MMSKYLVRWQDFWRERQPRERLIIGGGAACLLLIVLYSLLFEPALTGRQKLHKSLPALREQSVELQSLISTATNLPPPLAQVQTPLTPTTVEESLKKKTLSAAHIEAQGNSIKIQFTNVAFFGVLDWLNEVHRATRWQVKEATFTPQDAGINASVTLGQL